MSARLESPLEWPANRPRTSPRRPGLFSADGRRITLHQARARVQDQLQILDGRQSSWRRVDGDSILISTNIPTRNDGEPRRGRNLISSDPGAVLYFELDGEPRCIAVDSFMEIEQNIAGIAHALDAIRRLERLGGGIMESALRGLQMLPQLPPPPWREVLGVDDDVQDLAVARARFRQLAKRHHPDHNDGQVTSRWDEVRAAWDRANRELGE